MRIKALNTHSQNYRDKAARIDTGARFPEKNLHRFSGNVC